MDGMEDIEELGNNNEEDEIGNIDAPPKSRPLGQAHYEQACSMSRGGNEISSSNDRTLDLPRQLPDLHYQSPGSSFNSQDLGAQAPETRSLQPPYAEPPRSPGETATGHTYSHLLVSAILCDEGCQETHKSALPPIGLLQNDDLESPTAMWTTTTVSQNSPKTSRELMKFFIDKIAPWVWSTSLSISV